MFLKHGKLICLRLQRIRDIFKEYYKYKLNRLPYLNNDTCLKLLLFCGKCMHMLLSQYRYVLEFILFHFAYFNI